MKDTIEKERQARKSYRLLEEVEPSCLPIFQDMSKGKLAWDMLILALAVLTSFAVGFELVILSLPD